MMEFVNWNLDPNKLWFDDGSYIMTEYESDEDGRVVNFADFNDFALLTSRIPYSFHIEDFEIVPVNTYGFLLSVTVQGGQHRETVFIPCYSYQSTYTAGSDASILHVIAYHANSGVRTTHTVICEEVLV